MADRKITELTNITGANVADTDEFVVVDASADETKAITTSELRTAIGNGDFTVTGNLTVQGTTVTVDSATAQTVDLGDGDKIRLGDDDDLQIYHDGSTGSYLDELGTGSLYLRSDGGAINLGTTGGDYFIRAYNGGKVGLYHNAQEKLATTSTGVDISGSITADGLTVDGTDTEAATSQLLKVRNSTTGEAVTIGLYAKADNDGDGNSGSITFDAGADGTATNNELRFSADHQTDTNPALSIKGNGDISFYEDTGVTPKFVWKAADERLGIGTSSPSRTLSVNGVAGFGNGTIETIVSFSDRGIFGTQSNHDLELRTNSTERLRITSSGSVGINTTSPATTLDVAGTITADAYNNDAALPTVRPSLLLDFANSKTLDPRITFTRGSTATYWDGKTTTKAEENLVKYSQAFTQSNWVGSGYTITDNVTTAPDGTTTATSIVPNTNSTARSRYTTGTTATGDNTQSLYVKANGYTKVALRESQAGAYYASFDLASGGSVLDTSNCTATITDVGNSWYRITMTGNRSGETRWSVYFLSPSYTSGSVVTAWTGDGTSGYYIWGAQLENRSSATAYTATTTAPIVKYQPKLQTAATNEARFDHDPVTGESKGLLIEESRTNLVLYSEQFTTGSWSTGATRTADQLVAPDGNLTADEVVITTGAYIFQIVAVSASTTYTASWYVKAGTATTHVYGFYDGSNSTFITREEYTITDGEDVGNGWYRVSKSVTTPSGCTNLRFYPLRADAGGDDIPGVLGSSYLWGAQLEAGSFPTSYIPTSGSTVTRSNDYAKITGTNFDFFNNTEGTIFAAYEKQAIYPSDSRFLVFSDTENVYTTNSVFIRGNDSPSSDGVQSYAYSTSSGSTFVNNSDYSVSTAASYEVNSINAAVNGTLASEITSAPLSNDISLMYIISSLNGFWFSKVAYYPKKLSNATLQAMTEA